ncbi:FAD-dependent oxidoreductase [Paenibacillus cremeus]|nr:FAD-dependent oxidoreductase [Paenibacillus cremeus]
MLAGAKTVYGSERESVTLWFSMAPKPSPGVVKNNFTSTVDVGDAFDYTRAILSARRRMIGHDHVMYVAPRESRHIQGQVRLTLTDQLTQRQWPDVVNIAFSNNDIKGHSTSDWVKMGLISPNLEIEIPYRVMIPIDLMGILVTGKAISVTHDGLPAVRMQADLENLGGVAGLAAAMSAAAGISPGELPVRELQQKLVEYEVLPPEVLQRQIQETMLTSEDMKYWIGLLDDSQKLYNYSDMGYLDVRKEPIPIVMVCTAGPEIVPLLKEELRKDASLRRLTVARALAWYGEAEAFPVLLEHMQPYLEEEELPPRSSKMRHSNTPPDQGAMPDLAYLLYTMAMLSDPRAIPVMEQAISKLKPTWEKLTDPRHGLFYYVDSICDIAERLGNSACVPILKKLHDNPLFQGNVMTEELQPDYFLERKAYLELVIGRALARCGEPEGLRILAAFTADRRKLLVRHARQELKDITGMDLESSDQWSQFASTQSSLQTKPWKAARGST